MREAVSVCEPVVAWVGVPVTVEETEGVAVGVGVTDCVVVDTCVVEPDCVGVRVGVPEMEGVALSRHMQLYTRRDEMGGQRPPWAVRQDELTVAGP